MLWFNTPKANSYQPPKYKIAVIIWCSVFPLQLIMPKILLPLAVLPKLPALFISSVIMVTLLNYLVMPFMMKLFSRWLIKK